MAFLCMSENVQSATRTHCCEEKHKKKILEYNKLKKTKLKDYTYKGSKVCNLENSNPALCHLTFYCAPFCFTLL